MDISSKRESGETRQRTATLYNPKISVYFPEKHAILKHDNGDDFIITFCLRENQNKYMNDMSIIRVEGRD